ncbi:MAG: hypothetical protein IJ681_06580 [Bacteroidales bacterium]|nr:hypothetical protein [Bacteroidales bacterium]
MKKNWKSKILLLAAVICFGCLLSSCSSWRKSKCGECPRWNYIMYSAPQNQ